MLRNQTGGIRSSPSNDSREGHPNVGVSAEGGDLRVNRHAATVKLRISSMVAIIPIVIKQLWALAFSHLKHLYAIVGY